jgi:hypothetical protein
MIEPLDQLRKHFKRDKNPVFAWVGIGLCFELNLDFPEWILAYLKSSAAALLRDNKSTSAREADRMGRALGFGRTKGQTGSHEAAYKALSDEILHKAVRTQLAAGEKNWRAYEIVAKEYGFSDSTVMRALGRLPWLARAPSHRTSRCLHPMAKCRINKWDDYLCRRPICSVPAMKT